jgi:hypothetical protein
MTCSRSRATRVSVNFAVNPLISRLALPTQGAITKSKRVRRESEVVWQTAEQPTGERILDLNTGQVRRWVIGGRILLLPMDGSCPGTIA